MFAAILNGVVVARCQAYAPLEDEYADTTAIIRNEDTNVSWPADPVCYAVHGADD